MIPFSRRLAAELLGTALLLAMVIGSGIMGQNLAGGNTALALLANAFATGCGLPVLILIFGPLTGAHFNPLVTLAKAMQGGFAWRDVPGYLMVQVVGAFMGAAAAHLMFGLPLYTASMHARSGLAQGFSEFLASFGLLAAVIACDKQRPAATPFAVGAYIAAAYWFTASTSFANPAVTLARAASNTFAGISPHDVPGFIVAQCLGMLAAVLLFEWLLQPLAAVETEG